MLYRVLEANMPRLEKKLQRIQNKCNKYDVEFTFNTVDTEVAEIKNDDDTVDFVNYVWVDVEGAVKHNDWSFIATIDHQEDGNIVRAFDTEIDIPTKYYHTACECEHCKTRRIRKETYLIHNSKTDDWKQVGKSCLSEFTSGLSAEDTAYYISLYDELIKGEAPYNGVHPSVYVSLKTYLCYVKACVDKFGYISSSDVYDDPTKWRAYDYYRIKECRENGISFKKRKEEIEEFNFDFLSESNQKFVDEAIEWIRNDESQSGFLFNLRMCCSEDYFDVKNLGFVTSLIISYQRELEHIQYEKKKSAAAESEALASEYQGEVGQRLTFETESVKCVYSFYTDFGVNYLYKIVDDNGNVYMWSTGKDFELEENERVQITGTVKEHSEYKGVKQTKITRCRVKEIKSEAPAQENVYDVLEDFALSLE